MPKSIMGRKSSSCAGVKLVELVKPEPYIFLQKATSLSKKAEWFAADGHCGKVNEPIHIGTQIRTYYNENLDRTTKRRMSLLQGGATQRDHTNYFSLLPDEILIEIFSYISLPHDRSVCSSICKRWLLLQSHMRRSDLKVALETLPGTAGENTGKGLEVKPQVVSKRITENKQSGFNGSKCENQNRLSSGHLSRCLQGKKATDLRLASIAIGTSMSGGLGDLSIRGGKGESSAKSVSDFGLSAIGIACNRLTCLSLWDCPNIGNQGLIEIGNGCCLLKKLDLIKCPQLGNKGLEAIAKGCPRLSILSLDSCAMIGNPGIEALGHHSAGLLSLSISRCPAVGDRGIGTVVLNCKSLMVLKLEKISITDNGLNLLVKHCDSLLKLSLVELEYLTEEGFSSLGGSSGLTILKNLTVTSCQGISDYSLPVIGAICKDLKVFTLVDSWKVTDLGLEAFVRLCKSIKVLNLNTCHGISGSCLQSSCGSLLRGLKMLHFNKCHGLSDSKLSCSSSLPSFSLNSLSITNCDEVGNLFLEKIGLSCPSLEELDLSGLRKVGDGGILAFLQSNNSPLSILNLNGCKNVTNKAVCVAAKHSGSYLLSLYLDGCENINDTALKVIAENCSILQDLDLSKCKITDDGVLALLATRGPFLKTLSLSGCEYITGRCLRIMQKVCGSLLALNLQGCPKLSIKSLESIKSRLWRCDILSA